MSSEEQQQPPAQDQSQQQQPHVEEPPATESGATENNNAATTSSSMSTTAKKKRRNFRHDLPVAKPFTEEEIAQREVQWNGSFSVNRRERGVPGPPVGLDTANIAGEKGELGGTVLGNSDTTGSSSSPTAAVVSPPAIPSPPRHTTMQNYSPQNSAKSATQMASRYALSARNAAAEWLQQQQSSNSTSQSSPSGQESGTKSPRSTTPRRKVHHLQSSHSTMEPFHPPDSFVVQPVRQKFFEGSMGYPVPDAHRVFIQRQTTPRSGRRGPSSSRSSSKAKNGTVAESTTDGNNLKEGRVEGDAEQSGKQQEDAAAPATSAA